MSGSAALVATAFRDQRCRNLGEHVLTQCTGAFLNKLAQLKQVFRERGHSSAPVLKRAIYLKRFIRLDKASRIYRVGHGRLNARCKALDAKRRIFFDQCQYADDESGSKIDLDLPAWAFEIRGCIECASGFRLPIFGAPNGKQLEFHGYSPCAIRRFTMRCFASESAQWIRCKSSRFPRATLSMKIARDSSPRSANSSSRSSNVTCCSMICSRSHWAS